MPSIEGGTDIFVCAESLTVDNFGQTIMSVPLEFCTLTDQSLQSTDDSRHRRERSMHDTHGLSRRDWLIGATGLAITGSLNRPAVAESNPPPPKSVAAVLTAYEPGLHADVLIGKILEGWQQDGGPGPNLKLASMYVEQFTERDVARKMSAKYDVPLFETIEGAVTVGSDRIPVDGVISVGEHGNYPYNEKGQHLYPRRRFFKEITDTFEKYGRIVPVFSDKHLGPVWSDAKWMYDRTQQMQIPFMAGSSMPVGYRVPDVSIPMGCEVEAVVGIGYSGLDVYGFHALEFLQCQVEAGEEPSLASSGCNACKGRRSGRPSTRAAFRKTCTTLRSRSSNIQGTSEKATRRRCFSFNIATDYRGTSSCFPSWSKGRLSPSSSKGKTRFWRRDSTNAPSRIIRTSPFC